MEILRRINRDGIHRGFQWPLEVGVTIECPDWKSRPTCGNGLHGLPEGRGNWGLLTGHYWAIIEADESDVVMIGDEKCKFRHGIIKAICDPDKENVKDFLMEHIPSLFGIVENREAFGWAKYIGDREVMIDRVIDSRWAYYWAVVLGDENVMIDRVTDSEYAYYWAKHIGDHEIMRDRVTDSQWVYYWGREIGDQEIMKYRVTNSCWAYCWGRSIGDHYVMRNHITIPRWAYYWANYIGDQEIMWPRVKCDPEYVEQWKKTIGEPPC